jgi:hypothetical protein
LSRDGRRKQNTDLLGLSFRRRHWLNYKDRTPKMKEEEEEKKKKKKKKKRKRKKKKLHTIDNSPIEIVATSISNRCD